MTREYTNKPIEMLSNGENSHETVVNAVLSYMSEDDVKDLMESNDWVEEEIDFDQWDSDEYDVELMKFDHDLGNFSEDDAEDYNHESIVLNSLVNGQIKQAKEQCAKYGLNYEVMMAAMK